MRVDVAKVTRQIMKENKNILMSLFKKFEFKGSLAQTVFSEHFEI